MDLRQARPQGQISHDVIASLGQCVQQESYALALKTAVTGSEPLRWRGGLVTALYKGKGSLSDVGSFRSILVSEVLAKRYHAWARQKLEPWLTSVAHCMQQGPVGHSGDVLTCEVSPVTSA